MDLDNAVYSVCREWYCSETLPLMYAVAYRYSNKPRDIPLRRLLKEIEATLSTNTYPGKVAALEAAISWIRNRLEHEAISDALRKLVSRARDAGLDSDDFDQFVSKAWES
jgi:hypothetical protein